MLEVTLLGVGGTLPIPNRHLSSCYLQTIGNGILIDCGEGTQVALRENHINIRKISVLCITHLHADHFLGIPGILATMRQLGKQSSLTIIGPAGIQAFVNSLASFVPMGMFPINFFELNQSQSIIDFGEFRIDCFLCEHSIPCYGYNVTIDHSGRFSLNKAVQNKVPRICWGALQQGICIEVSGKRLLYKDCILDTLQRKVKFSYVTDTRPSELIKRSIATSDLAVLEGMYTSANAQSRAAKYKHMTFKEAALLAKDAQVAQVWLTHFAPDLLRPDFYINEARYHFEDVVCGEQGMHKTLVFRK